MGDDVGHVEESREESERGNPWDRYSSGMRHSEGGWRGLPGAARCAWSSQKSWTGRG
jgi:hypothetical protein